MPRQAMSLQSLPFHNPTCSAHLYIDFLFLLPTSPLGGLVTARWKTQLASSLSPFQRLDPWGLKGNLGQPPWPLQVGC